MGAWSFCFGIHAILCFFIRKVCSASYTKASLSDFHVSSNPHVYNVTTSLYLVNESILLTGDVAKKFILHGSFSNGSKPAVTNIGLTLNTLIVNKTELLATNITFVNTNANTAILLVQGIVKLRQCEIKNERFVPGGGIFVFGGAIILDMLTTTNGPHSIMGCCYIEPYNSVNSIKPWLGKELHKPHD